MKKIDFGQTITILVNLGVIVGIAFLAVEMQQNNRLLVADAQFSRLQFDQSINEQVIANPELAELLHKARTSQPLTEVEEDRVFRHVVIQLRALEWRYLQHRSGALDEWEVLDAAIAVTARRPEVSVSTNPEHFAMIRDI